MAGSLNRVELIGTLGRDPEIRSLQDGTKVANLSLATNERWTDKASGEKKERTEWHRVVIWGKLADIAERFLAKGLTCYVSGQLRTRKWTDQAGVEKFSTEVVLQGYSAELILLEFKDRGEAATESGGRSYRDRHSDRGMEQTPANFDDLDSDIPF